MGLETMFAMGGVLVLLGTLGIWSGAQTRVRGRIFRAETIPVLPMLAREQ